MRKPNCWVIDVDVKVTRNLKRADIIWPRSNVGVGKTHISSSLKVHGVWENKVSAGQNFRKLCHQQITRVQLRPEDEGITQRRYCSEDAWVPYSVPLMYLSILPLVLHCLNYYSLNDVRANLLTIFFRSILIIFGPWLFYINFTDRLTNSIK